MDDAGESAAADVDGVAANQDGKGRGQEGKTASQSQKPLLIAGGAIAALLLLAGAWGFGLIDGNGGQQRAEQERPQAATTDASIPVKRPDAKDTSVERPDAAADGTPKSQDTSKTHDTPKTPPDKPEPDKPQQAAIDPAVMECDRLAMSPLDPDRVAGISGVLETRGIDPAAAIPACEKATQAAPNERRVWANLARSYRAANNTVAAVDAYRKAAERGSMFGAYGLGIALRDNPSMQRDPGEARRQLHRAAQGGLAFAMYEYANMLEAGTGGPVDVVQARHWYEQAAADSHPFAMNAFGIYLVMGRGGPADPAKGRELFERAAKLGNADAHSHLGFLYETGQGVSKHLTMAQSQYREAANKGSTLGMRRLATLLAGYGGSNVEEAKRWLTTAIEKGDVAAMTQMGYLYRDGKIGGRPDYFTARQWFEKAAERGNGDAMSELGYLYHNGFGVPRDFQIARSWYEKAVQRGNTTAMTNLGALYEYGAGVPQSFSEAWRLFETAATRGNTSAMLHLGEMLANGKGVNRDFVRARDWYIKAGDNGNPTGHWRAALMTDRYGVNPDRRMLAQFALKAAKNGSQEAVQGLLSNPERMMSRELRAAIEQQLANDGYYEGPIRGQFDRKVREAVQAYFAGPSKKQRIN